MSNCSKENGRLTVSSAYKQASVYGRTIAALVVNNIYQS